MYKIDVKKKKEKPLLNTQAKMYKGFPVTLSTKQKIDTINYMESLGIIDFCYNIKTDTGFLFKCDFNEKYPEEFMSYNLHNTIEDCDNAAERIKLLSDSISGFGDTQYLNQDSTGFKLTRKLNPKIDTTNISFFYNYNINSDTDYWFGCAFEKHLNANKKMIALGNLMEFVQNMLHPLDNLVSDIAKPKYMNV